MKAVWNNTIIAESNQTIEIEGNAYFPPGDVKSKHLKPSETHTHCPWKGEACYYTLNVNGKTNPDAAWYYPEPKEAANKIKDYIAFWNGVQVEK